MIGKRRLFFFGLILVLVFGIALKVKGDYKDEKMVVKTVRIIKKDISSHVQGKGKVFSKNYRDITAEVGGKIKGIFIQEGDSVKRGQILVQLDGKDLDYEIKQGEIKLAMEEEILNQLREGEGENLVAVWKNAKMTYEDALAVHQRQKELYNQGGLSKKELNSGKNALDDTYENYLLAKGNLERGNYPSKIRIQEKKIELLKLSLEKLKNNLNKYTLYSPMDGIIVDLPIMKDGVIPLGNPILRIEDTRDLEIMMNISEYDIHKIQIGDPVEITTNSFEGEIYEGRVKYMGPRAVSTGEDQEKERTIKVKVEVLDGRGELLPGFSVNADILTDEKKDALVIPYEGIFTKKNGQRVVYTLENGRVKSHIIQTGVEGDLVVEVISKTLKNGDYIILNPTEKLKDGDIVREDREK